MPDPEVIRQIKSLPDDASLTPDQLAALDENLDLILKKTLPAKAASTRGSLRDVIDLFETDSRFRFLDQIPDAFERIDSALRHHGGSWK